MADHNPVTIKGKDATTGLPTDIVVIGGAASVVDGALAFGPIHDDGTWQYFGEAAPGSSLSAAVWRVSRVNKTTGQEQWADGNGNFDNVYTDSGTVTGLTYS